MHKPSRISLLLLFFIFCNTTNILTSDSDRVVVRTNDSHLHIRGYMSSISQQRADDFLYLAKMQHIKQKFGEQLKQTHNYDGRTLPIPVDYGVFMLCLKALETYDDPKQSFTDFYWKLSEDKQQKLHDATRMLEIPKLMTALITVIIPDDVIQNNIIHDMIPFAAAYTCAQVIKANAVMNDPQVCACTKKLVDDANYRLLIPNSISTCKDVSLIFNGQKYKSDDPELYWTNDEPVCSSDKKYSAQIIGARSFKDQIVLRKNGENPNDKQSIKLYKEQSENIENIFIGCLHLNQIPHFYLLPNMIENFLIKHV